MVSDEFKMNVAKGDLNLVRSSLINYFIVDNTFKQFDEALDYAKLSMNVIEKNGDPTFDEDSDNWDEKYFDRQLTALLFNFSEERIKHLKDVRNVLEQRKVVKTVPHRTDLHNEKRNRTGEKVLSEKVINGSGNSDRDGQNKYAADERTKSDNSQGKTHSGRKSKTGERVINEKTEDYESTHQANTPLTTWLIGGGIVLFALGGVTAVLGASKVTSALLKTSVVVAGTGVVMKVIKK